MTDEQPNNDNEVTPKGAVEVNEEDLDQAAGGLSLNYSKIEYKQVGQKASPSLVTGAGPGGGPHVEPVPDDGKKI